jgi:hypothetical protein
MHPTLVARQFHHEGWVYEEKVDGYRMVASLRSKDSLGVVIEQVRPITFVSAPGGGCSSSLRGSDGASA